VAALHELGPDYQSPLLGAAESSSLLDRHPAAAAALALGGDGGEAAQPHGPPPKLLLALCPETAAADGGDAPAGPSGGGRALRDAAAGLPAALLPGSQLCRTKQPREVLHCLGGVAALLPLLQQRAGAEAAGATESGGTAPGVLRLLAAMLRGSPTNQQAALETDGGPAVMQLCLRSLAACTRAACCCGKGANRKGGILVCARFPAADPYISCFLLPTRAAFALAAHLLEQAPRGRAQLGPQLLAAQQALLAAAGGCPELGRAALRHLLLNLRLWSGAAPHTQLRLAALWRQLAQVCACVCVGGGARARGEGPGSMQRHKDEL
jgi:hypothetical protein